MKALSLWRPWASAIAVGLKKIETRSWHTHYRGRLAIVATKNTPKGDLAFFETLDLYEASVFAHAGIGVAADLPRSAVVATVDLVDCVEMTAEFIRGVSGQEQEWGIYARGRFAWLLENVVRLEPPIPVARGGQRLWNWNEVPRV